jgi:RNA polymerase sigma-70 factor (ECF subfamily)
MPHDNNPDLAARARRAYERSIDPAPREMYGPVHPDEIARLERLMQAMPVRTREIFFAHRLDGYSYAKIADITGLSVRQIESHMAKAIYQLYRSDRGNESSAWQRWWQSHLPCWRR